MSGQDAGKISDSLDTELGRMVVERSLATKVEVDQANLRRQPS